MAEFVIVNKVTDTGPPGEERVVSVDAGADAWKSNLAASNSQYGKAVTRLPVAEASDPVVLTLIVYLSIAISGLRNKQPPLRRCLAS